MNCRYCNFLVCCQKVWILLWCLLAKLWKVSWPWAKWLQACWMKKWEEKPRLHPIQKLLSHRIMRESKVRILKGHESSKSKPKSSKELTCFHYLKPRHMKKECGNSRKNEKGEGQKRVGSQKLYPRLKVTWWCSLNLRRHLTCKDSSWVIDIGASYHATPWKDFFAIYKSSDFSVVRMRNSVT